MNLPSFYRWLRLRALFALEDRAVGRGRTVSRVLFPRVTPGAVTIYLGRRSPGASSDRYPRARRATFAPTGPAGPAGDRPPIWSCSERGLPGRPVTRPPVGSYPTISPLPARAGGVISVALSFGSPRLGVTQRPALRSPDFPPRPTIGAERSPVRLGPRRSYRDPSFSKPPRRWLCWPGHRRPGFVPWGRGGR